MDVKDYFEEQATESSMSNVNGLFRYIDMARISITQANLNRDLQKSKDMLWELYKKLIWCFEKDENKNQRILIEKKFETAQEQINQYQHAMQNDNNKKASTYFHQAKKTLDDIDIEMNDRMYEKNLQLPIREKGSALYN